jgi:Protein of unknown function (DUF2726)
MTTLLIVISVLLLIVIALAVLARMGFLSKAGSTTEWPFYAKRPLTQPEQVLYHRLVRALPEHIVLAQVQVSRVLGVKKGHNFHSWNNRINRLSYDFVICSKDATVVAAVELDDKSHERSDRAATDDKKNVATSAAGVRLVRWNVKALPNEDAIRATFGPRADGVIHETSGVAPASAT